jgi:hypothetical protein
LQHGYTLTFIPAKLTEISPMKTKLQEKIGWENRQLAKRTKQWISSIYSTTVTAPKIYVLEVKLSDNHNNKNYKAHELH